MAKASTAVLTNFIGPWTPRLIIIRRERSRGTLRRPAVRGPGTHPAPLETRPKRSARPRTPDTRGQRARSESVRKGHRRVGTAHHSPENTVGRAHPTFVKAGFPVRL